MKAAKDNDPLSSLTHFIGVGLSVAALVLLVVFASIHGSASHVVGASIFGSSLILLYAASSIYHFLSRGTRRRDVFERIDHAMIYVLIAGTYTPITLLYEPRALGWVMFGLIWGLAALGVGLEITGKRPHRAIELVIYILMGWMIAFPFPVTYDFVGFGGFMWLLIGGICYTVGAIFYALDYIVPRTRWFGMHEVFHLCVLGGSFAHFWFVLRFL